MPPLSAARVAMPHGGALPASADCSGLKMTMTPWCDGSREGAGEMAARLEGSRDRGAGPRLGGSVAGGANQRRAMDFGAGANARA
jgi:hypothetical protein